MGTSTDIQNEQPQEQRPGCSLGYLFCFGLYVVVLVMGGLWNRNAGDNKEATSVPPRMVNFQRVATLPVCLQWDPSCNIDNETVAEIVQATDDGMMLAYTDGQQDSVGFLDITDPSSPIVAGTVNVGGEPTSLVIKNKYVVVGVNTSPDYVNPSGNLQVIDIESREIVAIVDLGGQPDSVALSPDKTFIAVAIENERDEDLNGGVIPQLPAGFLQIVDCSAENPMDWTATKLELTDLEGVAYPSDPEPEFVAISNQNVAVVTLQENNAIVLVDLASASVLKSFSAGNATVDMVDVAEDGIISQTGSVTVPREPDGVTWIGDSFFATADEEDLNGGSRGFTIFDTEGGIVYNSGNMMEELAIRYGHYPDERSENKGNEPENVLYEEYGNLKLLFVGSERSSLIFVYEVSDVRAPVFRQVLPTGGVKPEGKCAIASRNLLVVAAEEDARGDKMRSAVSLYQLEEMEPSYPHLVAGDDAEGKPIPFSALSSLSFRDGMLYSVEDSFYKKSRMFVIDPSNHPYTVTSAVMITDPSDVLSGILSANASAIVMNEDKSVNLDLEGIEAVEDGFWLVSEGLGTVDDVLQPLQTPNLLLFVNANGEIEKVVTLPDELNDGQLRFGLEGVAVDGDMIVVTFQRAWTALGDSDPRIGIYDTVEGLWKFLFYPLDAPESQNGGWVGLSDIACLEKKGSFLVIERDNQGLLDAAIKKIYAIDLGDYSLLEDGSTIRKTFVHDLIPDLLSTGGMVAEKVEGLAIDANGNAWISNDNDGVDDNTGEQLLLNVGVLYIGDV